MPIDLMSHERNTQAADVEDVPPSNRAEIISRLIEGLAREYKAIIQYVLFSSTLEGPAYGVSQSN